MCVKRIALVLPELLPVPPVKGGAVEHWIHEATKRYAPDQAEVTVVSRPAGTPGVPGVRYLGIPWTTWSQRLHNLKARLRHGHPMRALAKVQNVWSYGRRLRGQTAGFDVVCLENDPNLLLFVRPRPGQRVVLHMHNEHLCSRALRPLYTRLLHRADAVLCVSEYIRRRSAEFYPEHAARFQVLMNATDPEYFVPLDRANSRQQLALPNVPVAGGPVVVYIGRLTEDKGVHVLLAAFARLVAVCPTARLVIAGSSFFAGAATTPYQDRLRQMAEPCRDNVVFTGFLPHDRIRLLYAAADIVVVPSIWQDPCPLVVLEAMSSGAAVVASAVGGIPEMLCRPEAGVLIGAGDADALHAALQRLWADAPGRLAMGQAARQLVLDKFSWPRLMTDFRAALEAAP